MIWKYICIKVNMHLKIFSTVYSYYTHFSFFFLTLMTMTESPCIKLIRCSIYLIYISEIYYRIIIFINFNKPLKIYIAIRHIFEAKYYFYLFHKPQNLTKKKLFQSKLKNFTKIILPWVILRLLKGHHCAKYLL